MGRITNFQKEIAALQAALNKKNVQIAEKNREITKLKEEAANLRKQLSEATARAEETVNE